MGFPVLPIYPLLWGLGPVPPAGPPTSMKAAVAIDTHRVRVYLTNPAMVVSPLKPGDATNPDTWEVTRLDTSADFTVLQVLPVGSDNTVFDLILREKLAQHQIDHQIQAPTLLDQGGNPIVAPTSFTVDGVQAATEVSTPARSAARGFAISDIDNPQAAGDTFVGGTMRMVGGDYANITGVPLMKKLILRRVLTRKGAFFHLPNYGTVLAVKEPIPVADMVLIEKDLEQSIAEEPELTAVQVKLQFRSATNILVIAVRARMAQTGESVALDIPLPNVNLIT